MTSVNPYALADLARNKSAGSAWGRLIVVSASATSNVKEASWNEVIVSALVSQQPEVASDCDDGVGGGGRDAAFGVRFGGGIADVAAIGDCGDWRDFDFDGAVAGDYASGALLPGEAISS